MSGNDLPAASGVRDEALEALIALGYSPTDALKALQSIEIAPTDSGESLLKKALKKLAFM